jgi:hypothetical protein
MRCSCRSHCNWYRGYSCNWHCCCGAVVLVLLITLAVVVFIAIVVANAVAVVVTVLFLLRLSLILAAIIVFFLLLLFVLAAAVTCPAAVVCSVPLSVLAVILSEAKDPEASHLPLPLEPFNQYPNPLTTPSSHRKPRLPQKPIRLLPNSPSDNFSNQSYPHPILKALRSSHPP